MLDQEVPSANNSFYYHPAFYYPPEYYNYLPTLWARHYQEIASTWQNFNEKSSFNNAAPIPGLNLPQPLNLPQIPPPFPQNPFNPLQQNGAAAQQNGGIPNLFQNQQQSTTTAQQQSDQQFQQHFQNLIAQQHQNAQLQQQQQQFGTSTQQPQQEQPYENDSNEKVKRDLYNEFFDLDSNAIKKEEGMLLPNAVAAALEHQVQSNIKTEDHGSDTDSVTSTDSSNTCSESSSTAVVDNIINSGVVDPAPYQTR